MSPSTAGARRATGPTGTPRATAGVGEGATGAPAFEASGGDWSQIAEEAARLGEERIVVNMGPQHPSTHGVLRLMLEIDGETVTEARAGIGYLHTGIEKNMEFRTWTQGVTFCTRMDYLAPLFQETGYCLAVEKLLGITDDVPERATVIRVLMMELNRISSHLVCLATGGNELGATTIMTIGFTAREELLKVFELITGLRMNHSYVRPGGVAQDIPPGALDTVREALTGVRHYMGQLQDLMLANPIFKARLVGVGHLNLAACMALAITGPVLRSTGLPYDVRKAAPYCGYETYDFDVPTSTDADSFGRVVLRIEECYQSMRIVEQCLDRLQAMGPGPVMVADKKVAWPAQLADRVGRHGQLPGPHPRDHGHLDGGAHPPLQAGDGGLPGPGRPGVPVGRGAAWRARRAPGVRRRHPPLPGPLPGPVVQQPAGRRDDVRGRPGGRRRRRGRLARPRAGRGGPLMAGYDEVTEARLTADSAEIIARYPQARSALLPMLHLVQSVDGYVSPAGIAFCARTLDLSTAEVSAVATFYTQYKRHPNGEYTVGVCINTLCAVMGGDAIWDELSDHLGVGHDETTDDGRITLERIECNAACDYAPVVMVNWEFLDNQTPRAAVETVERLRAGQPVAPTRGADTVCSFRQMSRVLAGFPDGRADEGVGAGPATVRGTVLARERGWTAPEFHVAADAGAPADGTPAAGEEQSSAERPPTTPADTSADTKTSSDKES